ncbi:MAG: NAD(P)H-hydrate epimerase, partial [Novosphingobium sp.]|nr:NAD(P)H-hydrate epimerase [Novosphingobium sp.]
MQTNPDQILTVAQMRAAEDALIAGGETVDSLMQIAGRGAAEYVWRMAAHRKVTVLCGPGNNGGDGYVIAEALRARAAPVVVVAPYEPATDAARNARSLYQGEVLKGTARPHGEVLVDCLFGSGLSRPLAPAALHCLTDLARTHAQRVAIDMPSGIDSDAGVALNGWLPVYDLTIALGAWKYAHWLMPSAEWMGERRLVPIGVGPVEEAARLVAKPRFAPPAVDAHKYSRGLALVAAGEMPGATLLACGAAMRGGAGYVKLASENPPAQRPPELVAETGPVDVALEDPRICAVLAGPGLGRSPAMRERLQAVLQGHFPLVLDADALVLFRPEMLGDWDRPVVATPHEGELQKLAAAYGIDETNKLHTAKVLARASGMVIVAKGPDTIVAAPDGRVAIARPATSWLSVAGTGDVLAG